MKCVEESKVKMYGFDIPIECVSMALPKPEKSGEFEVHYHDYVELLYGIDCSADIWCNGKTYRMESGDLIVINSKKPHTVSSAGDVSKYIVIKFMPQILYAAEQSVLEFKYIVPFIADNDKYKNKFTAAELEKTLVPDTVTSIAEEWEKRDFGFEIALRANTLKLVLWLIRYWHCEVSDNRIKVFEETTDAIHSIQKSIEYAQKSFSTATSHEAAEKCNLSYSYFSRLFKRVMKKSFTEYVNSIRITEAERLLATTNAPVTEIALDVGFSTTSYFIEAFKKQVHQTPKKFRQSFQKK